MCEFCDEKWCVGCEIEIDGDSLEDRETEWIHCSLCEDYVSGLYRDTDYFKAERCLSCYA